MALEINCADVESFKKRLSRHLKLSCEIVVNDNRSTMLSVLDRGRGWARLSLHRMFLDAPEKVISAIAHYVRGTAAVVPEEEFLLRGYIQSNLSRFNYTSELKRRVLVSQGAVYDLRALYEGLNREYFQSRLDLQITWFGYQKKARGHRVTFGQYYDHLKLIKIHRMLDDRFYPEYFVRFVIYHEMLHEVVPGYMDERGVYRIHGENFKCEERAFKEYEQAIAWEKRHKMHFFK